MDKKDIKHLKMYIKAKRFLLYTLRWQLSTPILAIVVMCLSGSIGTIGATVIANLVGAAIFYWVDKYIFLKHRHESE